MTLLQFTNLPVTEKISTLNSLLKGLIKFDKSENDIFKDMLGNLWGNNK